MRFHTGLLAHCTPASYLLGPLSVLHLGMDGEGQCTCHTAWVQVLPALTSAKYLNLTESQFPSL